MTPDADTILKLSPYARERLAARLKAAQLPQKPPPKSRTKTKDEIKRANDRARAKRKMPVYVIVSMDDKGKEVEHDRIKARNDIDALRAHRDKVHADPALYAAFHAQHRTRYARLA